ncbi:MAG: hypothetical protein JXA69_07440 [Phycisphaerae bacterium]|nr:hypothetical protein [Phycisphaerae bacterium]
MSTESFKEMIDMFKDDEAFLDPRWRTDFKESDFGSADRDPRVIGNDPFDERSVRMPIVEAWPPYGIDPIMLYDNSPILLPDTLTETIAGIAIHDPLALSSAFDDDEDDDLLDADDDDDEDDEEDEDDEDDEEDDLDDLDEEEEEDEDFEDFEEDDVPFEEEDEEEEDEEDEEEEEEEDEDLYLDDDDDDDEEDACDDD